MTDERTIEEAVSDEAMSDALEVAKLSAIINRIALGPADLDRLQALSDRTACDALASFSDEDWRHSPLAVTLLGVAISLRRAGRRPSAFVVEAMERFVAGRRSAPAEGRD